MGRGFKWAIFVLVSTNKISRAIVPQQKKISLDDIMMGNGFGKIQIKFEDTPKRVTNDGNVHNGH
jgi:hypothetical protein